MNRSSLSSAFAIEDRILLGEGLFETLRVNNSKPCFADLHWQRMRRSAQVLGISFDLTLDTWNEYLEQQIHRDHLYHGGMKVILSGGPAPRGLAEQGQMSQLRLQSFNYTLNHNPLRLVSASWLRDAANPVYQLKSVNYLEAVLACRQALAQGKEDALFFNTQLHAMETTTANIFVVKSACLYTPPLSDGVLAGITRLRVLQYCTEHHIPYFESSLTREMILESEAVFTTNCLHGIRYVRSFDEGSFLVVNPLVEQISSFIRELS